MAKLIDGKQIARDVLDEVVAELKQIHVTDAEFAPLLAIVQVIDGVCNVIQSNIKWWGCRSVIAATLMSTCA